MPFGLLVQEVTFSTKQFSSHLDVICPLKSASKANLSNLPSFDHLTCADDFSQMAGPNSVKLFSSKIDSSRFDITSESLNLDLKQERCNSHNLTLLLWERAKT